MQIETVLAPLRKVRFGSPEIVLLTSFSGLAFTITEMAAPTLLTLAAGMIAVVGSAFYRHHWKEPRERIPKARNALYTNYSMLVPQADGEWLEMFRGLERLMKDKDAAISRIGDTLALQLADLARVYCQAVLQLGRADKEIVQRDASIAARTLITNAFATYDDMDRQVRSADNARLADIHGTFLKNAWIASGSNFHPTALSAPSASAALQRLIGLSENALAVEPDLVDASGARLDALVREHLPRLLEVHAEAARTARGEDLAKIDEQLGKSVELVRMSVEEALASDARHRFNRLEDEVRFLHLRRDIQP